MEIEHLLAIEEIKQLKARYFRLVDAKDWASFRALFSAGATMHFPEARADPIGLDEAMDMIVQTLTGCTSVHIGFLPEISILGPTMASGIWAMEDILVWDEARANEQGLSELHGFGRYHERYERDEGGWKIMSLRLERSRLTTASHMTASFRNIASQ
jgi:hypothetical protein